jgi:hypothetical protein
MIASTEILNDLNFPRRTQHLWRLGPRATGELLLELAAISGRRTWLDQRLDDYAAIDPAAVEAARAHDWPVPLLHIVGGRRS